jgi:hypothetical protein
MRALSCRRGPGHRRAPPGDDIAKHVPGPAGMRPAKRTMAGVEIEVLELGVAGRSPVQNCALAASATSGNISSVRRTSAWQRVVLSARL